MKVSLFCARSANNIKGVGLCRNNFQFTLPIVESDVKNVSMQRCHIEVKRGTEE